MGIAVWFIMKFEYAVVLLFYLCSSCEVGGEDRDGQQQNLVVFVMP